MIGQTAAMFVDAYRELNSRKLFWITLIISGIVMGAFALLGIGDDGLTFLGRNLGNFTDNGPAGLYSSIFSIVVIGAWLTWGAVILALISTAGIFPDFMAGGSIELYVCRPMSRFRLFLTRYMMGLLFATLQVTIFCIASFVVFGLRAHIWEPRILLGIPLVVCMFSYLFGICVLVGVLTRSTITAILLTIGIWAMLSMAQRAENGLLTVQLIAEYKAKVAWTQQAAIDRQISQIRANSSATTQQAERLANLSSRSQTLATEAQASHAAAEAYGLWHRWLYKTITILPKTKETTDMLDRWLPLDGGAQGDQRQRQMLDDSNDELRSELQAQEAGGRGAVQTLRNRSAGWVIGTSLAFEAVTVLLAAWLFCRRDY